MLKNFRFKKFETHLKHLKQEQGQSIVILAFAVIGLLAMVGLALDLGLVYIERIALKRAIDAAVLAGVIELPVEEDAGQRAMQYLNLNNYDVSETVVFFQGCLRDDSGTLTLKKETDEYVYYYPPAVFPGGPPKLADARTRPEIRSIFWIDTLSFQDQTLGELARCSEDLTKSPAVVNAGTANKLKVIGEVKVDMNFMLFIGFDTVSVSEQAVAQNVDNIDAVVVLDKSGSMEFDPVCYGCWERTKAIEDAANAKKLGDSGWETAWPTYYNYPGNGQYFPIGYPEAVADPDPLVAQGGFAFPEVARVCNPPSKASDSVIVDDGFLYMVIEAELYSYNNTTIDNALRETGKGYWALQRGEGNYDSAAQPYFISSGSSIDKGDYNGKTYNRGAHMAHHPSSTFYPPPDQPLGYHYTLTDAQNENAPALRYDFKFYSDSKTKWPSGDVYIWARVHGGRGLEVDGKDYGFPLYGDSADGVDAYWRWTSTKYGNSGAARNIPDLVKSQKGTGWRWVLLNKDYPLSAQTDDVFTLYFYAGSSGFSIDRLVVTNDPDTSASANLPTDIKNGTAKATDGSARGAACSPCNPIYGEVIQAGKDPKGPDFQHPYYTDECTPLIYNQAVDHRQDLLFGEWETPMRTAKEAIKLFADNLDPERDQLGFVAYNNANKYTDRIELECIRKYGKETCQNVYGYAQVKKGIEDVRATNTTNTGAGMKAGLEILGIDLYDPTNESNLGTDCAGGTCSRGASAQRVMILITDGVPNENPGNPCTTGPDPTAPGIDQSEKNWLQDHRCPLYFAQQARTRGVTVYVIGLGFGVNRDYLKEIADYGGGQFYASASGADLEIIFTEILNNVFVRLIE